MKKAAKKIQPKACAIRKSFSKGRLDNTSLANELKQHVGKYIALLCARYVYRGLIQRVGSNVIVLQPAACVEVTGSWRDMRTTREEPFAPDVPLILSLDAVEIASFPDWVAGPFKEETAAEKRRRLKRNQIEYGLTDSAYDDEDDEEDDE